MNIRQGTGIFLLCFTLLAGCSPHLASPTPGLPATPTTLPAPTGLTQEQLTTLGSLRQINDYPFYTMTYSGAYRPRETAISFESFTGVPDWACSLFTVLLDEGNMLYGRNFDWQFSPALLLFIDPPDGYASVSMVDIAYLGFDEITAKAITDMSIEEQASLLDAPYLPFDGMNEYGLAIGMAAVPSGNMQPDVAKESIGSLGIIRQILDHARTVDEAVEIMQRYSIDFTDGPSLHYLIADATGKSVLVEYNHGEMQVIPNDRPWQVATNFLRSSVEHPENGNYWRYNKISTQLTETNGRVNPNAAMQLLADVAQNNTQWSVIYQMNNGTIIVAMGQQYQDMYQFQLDLVSR